MYLFYVVCAFLCVMSVLTSDTKKGKKLDHEIESANNLSSTTVKNDADQKSQNASKISAAKMGMAEKMKLNFRKSNPPAMEGGGEFTQSFAPSPVSKVPLSPKTLQEVPSSTPNSTKEGIQTERAISPRKEAPPPEATSNIKARKGVGNETYLDDSETSSEDSMSKLDGFNSSTVLSSSPSPSLQEITSRKSGTYLNTTTKYLPSTKTSVSEAPQKMSTEKAKKKKLKPTVTVNGSNVDAPIPASPTKTPPLGMPRKIDYIVPVMITIFALPILGVATYVLYRRGRDCWDKRHYRRMDFLIDGMYND